MLIKGELRFIKRLKELERYNIDSLDDIEEQLIRGEKFEEMWRELKLYGIEKLIIERVKYLEQKYFPAPRVKFTPFTEGFAQGYKAGLDFLEAQRKRGM